MFRNAIGLCVLFLGLSFTAPLYAKGGLQINVQQYCKHNFGRYAEALVDENARSQVNVNRVWKCTAPQEQPEWVNLNSACIYMYGADASLRPGNKGIDGKITNPQNFRCDVPRAKIVSRTAKYIHFEPNSPDLINGTTFKTPKAQLFLPQNTPYDLDIITEYLYAAGRAFEFYEMISQPLLGVSQSYLFIAASPYACLSDKGIPIGVACGLPDTNSIELTMYEWDYTYRSLKEDGLFDHVTFYEIGRASRYSSVAVLPSGFGGQLWYTTAPDVTPPFWAGFSIANRFISMEFAQLDGAPFAPKRIDFATFRDTITRDLLKSYRDTRFDPNTKLTWRETFTQFQDPKSDYGWQVYDLAGAFFYQVYLDANKDPKTYGAFWNAIQLRGNKPKKFEDFMDNFIYAGKSVLGIDYTYLFENTEP